MTEIEIAFTCAGCDSIFDDMDDGSECNICKNGSYICESCQEDHAIGHCFDN